jgi:hypothetical protein
LGSGPGFSWTQQPQQHGPCFSELQIPEKKTWPKSLFLGRRRVVQHESKFESDPHEKMCDDTMGKRTRYQNMVAVIFGSKNPSKWS